MSVEGLPLISKSPLCHFIPGAGLEQWGVCGGVSEGGVLLYFLVPGLEPSFRPLQLETPNTTLSNQYQPETNSVRERLQTRTHKQDRRVTLRSEVGQA